MLTEPLNGRCTFSLFDINIQMSCVTDIPVDWLRTCKFALENEYLASFILADNGYEYIVFFVNGGGAVLIKDVDGERSMVEYEINLPTFTEQLIEDVRKFFEGWVNWYPAKILGGPDEGRGELLKTLLADTEEALNM